MKLRGVKADLTYSKPVANVDIVKLQAVTYSANLKADIELVEEVGQISNIDTFDTSSLNTDLLG